LFSIIFDNFNILGWLTDWWLWFSYFI